jgi:outer membrane protein assembly factor BamB
MKKKHAILAAMWGAALIAGVFIWAAQPETDAPPRPVDDGTPVRSPGTERAPPEKRAHLPVRPPEEGPPRTFRNDRRHTGRSPYRGPASATLSWSYRTGGRVSSQAVIAPDGTIYVGSHDHFLYALDPHGGEKWKRDLGDRIYATPLVDDDGNVYCGSDGDVFSSFAPSGELRFRLETEGDADTGAVVAPNGAIHFAAGNHLYALTKDGTVRWRFEARSKIYSTPAVDDDGTVYVGSQDDELYAVAADGRLRWSYRTQGDNDASPAIGDDGTIYFGSDDGRVYALTRDGELRWSTPLDGYVRAPLALGLDGSIIAGVYGPRPRVVSLDAATGELRWFFPVTVTDSPEIGVHSGPLVDADGNIYVGAHDDYLYSLTPEGDLRWIFGTDADVDGSPIVSQDGVLLVGSDDGNLYALGT